MTSTVETMLRRLRGSAAVRACWLEQWRRIHTHDHVTAVAEEGDGACLVGIDQVVRTPGGALVSSGRFEHRYRVEGGLVPRMDLRKP